MSYKVEAFRVLVPQPLLSCKFIIIPTAPELIKTGLLIETATFPTEVTQEVAFLYKGQRVYFPIQTDVPDVWKFTVPDTIFTDHRAMIWRRKYRDPEKTFDIVLCMTDISGILSLDNIGGGIVNAASIAASAFLSAVVLKECYITDIAQGQLNASDPTQPMKWDISVRYQGIVPFTKLM